MDTGSEIGALYVRRSGFIHASPGRVWEEFESFEKLAACFGLGHILESYEPKLGAPIRFSAELDGVKRMFGGEILVFEPARELTHSENGEVDPLPALTFFTIRLTPIYEGHEEGWHTKHIAVPRKIVEGHRDDNSETAMKIS